MLSRTLHKKHRFWDVTRFVITQNTKHRKWRVVICQNLCFLWRVQVVCPHSPGIFLFFLLTRCIICSWKWTKGDLEIYRVFLHQDFFLWNPKKLELQKVSVKFRISNSNVRPFSVYSSREIYRTHVLRCYLVPYTKNIHFAMFYVSSYNLSKPMFYTYPTQKT